MPDAAPIWNFFWRIISGVAMALGGGLLLLGLVILVGAVFSGDLYTLIEVTVVYVFGLSILGVPLLVLGRRVWRRSRLPAHSTGV